MLALDVFLLERLSGRHRLRGSGVDAPLAVVSWAECSAGNVIGIVSILAGLVVGAVTGGLIPGTAGFGKTNIGVPALEGWLATAVLYVAGMALTRLLRSERAKRIWLGLPLAAPADLSGLSVTVALASPGEGRAGQ